MIYTLLKIDYTMATGLENLKIYVMAGKLELEIHKLTTNFPNEEKYRSTDQLRRSSSSVTNNIAEAYYKKSKKERVHILRNLAITELEETRTNIIRSADKDLLNSDRAKEISEKYIELRRAIFGYIKFIENFPNSSTH